MLPDLVTPDIMLERLKSEFAVTDKSNDDADESDDESDDAESMYI